MSQDSIFAEKQALIKDFSFNADTVSVFDDMVNRSVPFYDEIQRMLGEMAADFATEGTNLYDLGCSTGTTLLQLDPLIKPGVQFIGVDNSQEMLDKARQKFDQSNFQHPVELVY